MVADFRLREGDHVALIAPASGQRLGEEALVEKALALLAKWQLNVRIQPTYEEHSRYLSATDQSRANDLKQALTDPDIKAIFMTRGGYGCARLLPYLSSLTIPSQRYLVGFSDITTLHLAFANQPEIFCLHAPNLATLQMQSDTLTAIRNRECLYQALFANDDANFSITPLFPERNHLADWQNMPKVGGCLSLLVTSLGTAHEIDTHGKILMIEEVSEKPYVVDRMLTHLRHAGKFDNVKAIILGEMVDCDSASIQLIDILTEYFADDTFPVFITKDFGHGLVNLPWLFS